ncbi:MAG: hypothetical protein IJD64_03075, partial [Clostridia bacterium]|nr:hypothetical protein [Clostridia bacterium]
LLAELSSAKSALLRAIEAIVQASDRYCETFPQSVKDGLPSYAEAKTNASAAYYMYATALTYVLKSAEGFLALLAPISARANEEEITEISEQCAKIISTYEAFSAEALSPYFEASQKLILSGGETISLTPLYRATRELQQRSEEFLGKLS